MRFSIVYLSFFILVGHSVFAQSFTHVDPGEPEIKVYGSNYIKMKDGELVIHRHPDEVYAGTIQSNLFNPLKARSSTGIFIEFKTKSPKVIAKFKIAKGWEKSGVFSVFQNGEFIENKAFKYKPDGEIALELTSKHPGKEVLYRITFPLRTDIHFLGLDLVKGYDLIDFKKSTNGTYVAFGDSITHGTGQQTTPETYAYQLAEMLGYQLFNLAVGGGKTSQVMAEMIRDDFDQVDLITILIGFNDYNGEGIPVKTYKKRYEKVLETIRSKHPGTPIYCITLLSTKAVKSKKSGIPAEEFRKAVREIVAKRKKNGDNHIYLIEGDKLTTISDLNDQVHLNVSGARKFAKELYHIIKAH